MENMKNCRVVYMLEKYSSEGELIYRMYFRNKRLAQRYERNHGKADMFRRITRDEYCWINIFGVR